MIYIMMFSVIFLCNSIPVEASDLDDGIGYTHDSITKYDNLGTRSVNRSYITVKAKSKAHMKGTIIPSGKGNKGIGNVNVAAGSTVNGDIIIIQKIRDANVISGN